MTKQSAVERMLLGTDQYATKTLIRRFGGYTSSVTDIIFSKCREIDSESIDIDIRPGHVLKTTYFKVAGINMNYEIRRLKESKKYKEDIK